VAQRELNLRDYWWILRRRRWLLVVIPLLFALSAFAAAVLRSAKPLYRATAVIRVDRAVSPASSLQDQSFASQEGFVETQAALIKGFPIISAAAKELGLIPRGATAEAIQASPATLGAVEELQERVVAVERVKDTSLIEIAATMSDPWRSVRIANSVAEAAQRENLADRSRQAREEREFIEGRLQEVTAELARREEELRTFQETKKVFLLSEEIRSALSRLGVLEAEQVEIKRATEEAELQVRLLDEGRTLARATPLSPDGSDPSLVRLNTALSELTLERENLLVTLLSTHPQVRQLDAQIANAQRRLKGVLATRLQVLRNRARELDGTIVRLKETQAAIPAVALELGRMERDVKVSERLFSLLKEKHQEALIKEKAQVGDVTLVRAAVLSIRPINPRRAGLNAGLGLAIGLVVAVALAFVAEALDTSIRRVDEIATLLETAVLGVIPRFPLKAEPRGPGGHTARRHPLLVSLVFPRSRVAEAFRALRANLLFAGLERDVKTLMVTSSTRAEGSSVVAVNLAIALAQLGKRTLLVDSDLRHPSLHLAVEMPNQPGLTDVVIGSARLDEAVRGVAALLSSPSGAEPLTGRGGIESLFILPGGHEPSNPAELWSAPEMANLLAEMRRSYDYVILDGAALLAVTDSLLIAARVDGTLLVVRVGHATRPALNRTKTLLRASHARLLGVCLNGVTAKVSPDYGETDSGEWAGEVSSSGQRRWLGLRLRSLAVQLLLALTLAAGVPPKQAGSLSLEPLRADSAAVA